MAICAHTPGKARGKCPLKKVAQEFSHKPKGGYRKKRKGVMEGKVGKYY